ncbi:MAG: endonuclease III [archaeon]
MEKKEKAGIVLSLLEKTCPAGKTFLEHNGPFELLAATILSAQCTDVRVNIATKPLFKKYRSVNDFANASQSGLEMDIFSTGFYRSKAKNIIACAKMVLEKHGGKVPKTMAKLVELPGVGRKTANIVLSSGFGIIGGMAVDTHVKRLSFRIGLSSQKYPQKVEKDLLLLVPKKKWGKFPLLLIQHGRAVCTARKPNCTACVLSNVCDSAFKF